MKKVVKPTELADYCADLLSAAGILPRHSKIISDCLVFAESRGIASHGVMRIPIYIARIREGLVNPRPRLKMRRVAANAWLVDADNAPGIVAASFATRLACRTAAAGRMSVVAVNNSNHFGAASYYAQMAIDQGLFGIAISNAPARVAPWGSREKLLGTNPLALGIPARNAPPLLLDMATSRAAFGKILQAKQAGKKIPLGWALDESGVPTDDPTVAIDASLLPFGEAKGSAIAVAIEVLSAAFVDANVSREVGDLYTLKGQQAVGHLFVAFVPDIFVNSDRLLSRLDDLFSRIRSSAPAQGFDSVQLPGDPERARMRRSMDEGLVLSDGALASLCECHQQLTPPVSAGGWSPC